MTEYCGAYILHEYIIPFNDIEFKLGQSLPTGLNISKNSILMKMEPNHIAKTWNILIQVPVEDMGPAL